MSKLAWIPWHKVVKLRDDVRTGELSLATFAADLYEVVMQRGTRKVYEDPAQFFALTYPTTNLRDLAKDVVLRLAGKNDKAIRQLELTYGGGKTHTLITLYHLVNDPTKLPDLPAVREFKAHIGIAMPQARIAVLSFDKLDVEKGMEVRDPKGAKRWLKQPWSVLAWQLAGAEGLKLLHAEDKAEERDSAPAENLLEALLRLPQRDGLATLILMDEVLMYAYEKVSQDAVWLGRLKNFFQYLTQAVVKVDRAALVASLLATDTAKSDELGKKILQDMSEIFAREREEGVQPVLKEDVAEVLRRRFFEPESFADKDLFREHVPAAIQGIVDLDENTRRGKKAAEARFLASYPFHPDLTDVFYAKWTSLDKFQRTRGVLRIFALALRDAEKWDESPLVGPNVFLLAPDVDGISEAARELTTVASQAQVDGVSGNWTPILGAELSKARDVQEEYPPLKQHREIEQAVFSTFVHSQPVGAKALLSELLVLIGATRPDKITLEKGLRLWFDRSWFLDESADADSKSAPGQAKSLPMTWRLGLKPNLRQMHDEACKRVSDDQVETRLLEDIRKVKGLTSAASAAGARAHNVPEKPSDIEDDGEFHYAVLGPAAASESGKPSAEARRYIEENTGPSNPRKERNAVVLAVPSREGLLQARQAIREYLGWEEVRSALRDQPMEPLRDGQLSSYASAAVRRIPEAVAQAYCIVVTVGENDEVQAFRVQVANQPLFLTIKADKRSRMQDTAISADAMLPGGPYDLWREGEDARRVKDLVGSFARFARLPKMLSRQAILDTIVSGCLEGIFVARLVRPDKSIRTFWRQRPEEAVLEDPGLEVVLPEKAELTEVRPSLLTPGVLKELWSKPEIAVREVHEFFAGDKTTKVERGDYEEALAVPRAPVKVVDEAVLAGVRDGALWLTAGPASLLAEEVPPGLLTAAAVLQAPPAPISPAELLPTALPAGWADGNTTALSLSAALAQKVGKTLPWATVSEAIDGALRVRMLERAVDSGPWPSSLAAAGGVRLRLASAPQPAPTPPSTTPSRPGARVAEAELRGSQIQDLAEVMGELLKAKGSSELVFRLRIELAGKEAPSEAVVRAVGKLLKAVSKDLDLK
jgi:hypothetical protein